MQPPSDVDASERWAASGLLSLSGTPTRPLGPPRPLVPGVLRLGRRFPDLDPLALLGERAALFGLGRQGTTSCGGGTRLLVTADGWIALTLARPEDMAAVPAWLECDPLPDSTPRLWDEVGRLVATRDAAELVARGVLLMLPLARLGEAVPRPPVQWTAHGDAPPRADLAGLTVVDLTSLWAGPLCGDLLARAGAVVLKVESIHRPDGARRGPTAFFDLLNGHKQSVALDLHAADGVRALRALVAGADVVLESSRPRALEQLGLGAAGLIAGGGPQVWVSITGYGRTGDGAHRVAFGDDAAVAGGLVVEEGGLPRFCADAVADPLSGLTAADACLQALAGGGRWLLDVAMAAVAAELAGPTLAMSATVSAPAPGSQRDSRPAPPMGADTARVLAAVGVAA